MANEQLDKLFSEYEAKTTKEDAERDHLRNVRAANTLGFGHAIVETILPALESLAADLRSKGCKVEVKSAGPGTGNDEHLEHSSGTIRIWPPKKHGDAVPPFEGSFSSDRSPGTFKHTRQIGGTTSSGSEPLTIERSVQEHAAALVLKLFRDVLLDTQAK
jgi:hypothetical protein